MDQGDVQTTVKDIQTEAVIPTNSDLRLFITFKTDHNLLYLSWILKFGSKFDYEDGLKAEFTYGLMASRTFTLLTLVHNWYLIDACQVNRPF